MPVGVLEHEWTLSITVLLSYSVFMLLVAESLPPTSDAVPLIGQFLLKRWWGCASRILVGLLEYLWVC